MDEEKKLTREEFVELIKKYEKQFTDEDVKKVLENQENIEDKVKKHGILFKYWEDIVTFFSILKDYITGKYKAIPIFTIVAITFSLLYIFSPIDLIPDFIPFVGYVDDAGVLSLALKLIHQDFERYREWKAQQ